ncbi:hypothetical protein [Glutamicibacter sp. FBE19]|uniref:hypothetical protein n=1 Tax=Glutamicibacter sp. FBE19 TaxID=2761534 RepID=UPI00189696B2|nr:hypothetical protein [Glutamicibacter sp. FBE19]MBF6671579.1 hypothetical protein [Glutamicibacter sp. FBE19]
MIALIVWAGILTYLAIGWMAVTPKLAVVRLMAMSEHEADRDRSWVLGTSVVLGIIWPACFAYILASNTYDKSIEEEQMLKQVRREVEEQKREARRRTELELEAFDRAMKEPK